MTSHEPRISHATPISALLFRPQARRNKCIKIVTYVLPIVTQSAGVAEYLSACYDDYDSATFTDRDIGAGCWCFIVSIIICVLLLIIAHCGSHALPLAPWLVPYPPRSVAGICHSPSDLASR